MYRTLIFLTILATLHACKKGSTSFYEPSIIDEQAACRWFPLSVSSIYNYSMYVPNSNQRPTIKADVTDTGLSIGDFVFSHDSCQSITISYRDMYNIPIILKANNSDSILSEGKTTTLSYKSHQMGYTNTITSQGQQLIFRQSQFYFMDFATGADSVITIKYIDNVGVYEISKMRLSETVTKNFMELRLIL